MGLVVPCPSNKMARLIAALVLGAVASTLTSTFCGFVSGPSTSLRVSTREVSVNRNFFDPGSQAGGRSTNGMFKVVSDSEKAETDKTEKFWGLVSAVLLGLLAFKIAAPQ